MKIQEMGGYLKPFFGSANLIYMYKWQLLPSIQEMSLYSTAPQTLPWLYLAPDGTKLSNVIHVDMLH